MRLLIQCVTQAAVHVEEAIVGQIGKGLLVFIGIHKEDTREECLALAEKLIHLRIFSDAQGKMNLSLNDVQGELLIVSQFTLYADCSKSRRPSFDQSAPFDRAQELYQLFVHEMRQKVPIVQTGQFGAYMHVSLINDGPRTFLLSESL